MKIRLVVIYLAIGCFCAATEFLIFFVLRNLLSVGIVTSNSAGIITGILISFKLNSTYNFKVADNLRVRFFRFLFVTGTGLIISNASLSLLVIFIDQFVAKALTMPFVAGCQFLANYFWTFQQSKHLKS